MQPPPGAQLPEQHADSKYVGARIHRERERLLADGDAALVLSNAQAYWDARSLDDTLTADDALVLPPQRRGERHGRHCRPAPRLSSSRSGRSRPASP